MLNIDYVSGILLGTGDHWRPGQTWPMREQCSRGDIGETRLEHFSVRMIGSTKNGAYISLEVKGNYI